MAQCHVSRLPFRPLEKSIRDPCLTKRDNFYCVTWGLEIGVTMEETRRYHTRVYNCSSFRFIYDIFLFLEYHIKYYTLDVEKEDIDLQFLLFFFLFHFTNDTAHRNDTS